MDRSVRFRQGITHFNAGEFFEAHETWEDLWHEATGDDRLFLQGMIQAAVTLVHLQRGNPRGVRSVWQSARPKLNESPSPSRGVDVAAFMQAMEAFLQPVLSLPDAMFAPGLPHGRALPADWRDAPQIPLMTN